jgi:4-hydroxy-tetrahydrodipicolinate reductase
MKVCICGICGRMGMSVLKVALERGHTLAGAFDSEKAAGFGGDAGFLVPGKKLDVTVSAINGNDAGRSDGIIDFSSPAASMELIEVAREQKKPVVIGTTGFTDEQRKSIAAAAGEIPVLLSPNMSLGVNLLFKLTEIAAGALSSDYDVEIFEAHHRYKKDAPSGTALKLLEIVKNNMVGLNSAKEVYGRGGLVGERTRKEVGVHAMRGGDVVGEHTVYFAGIGERIELVHRASSRETLAKGSVAALEFLYEKKAGLYSMYDVLGF